jgi:hypothetical protein
MDSRPEIKDQGEDSPFQVSETKSTAIQEEARPLMTSVPTKSCGADKPWVVYKHKDGSRDKLYEPGWEGTLDDDEVERLQQALATDPNLAYWWGWRPRMRRRAVAAIERVACFGDPEIRSVNVRLVREAGRRAKADTKSAPARVKQSNTPAPARRGRRRIGTWESELLRMAASGMGVKAFSRELRGQGVEISHATVASRLRELKGLLRLIS